MLVDHLGHGVFQENHILVERLNVPLQLDSVDEVDRHRDMLFAQRI